MDTSPKSEPALELHSRDAPSVEAHHRVNGPNAGRNSGGRRIINKNYAFLHNLKSSIGSLNLKLYYTGQVWYSNGPVFEWLSTILSIQFVVVKVSFTN